MLSSRPSLVFVLLFLFLQAALVSPLFSSPVSACRCTRYMFHSIFFFITGPRNCSCVFFDAASRSAARPWGSHGEKGASSRILRTWAVQ